MAGGPPRFPVPDAGTFAAFEAALDTDGLGAVLAARSTAGPGAVNMPAFGFKTDSGLQPPVGQPSAR